jgi:hypothetical protein
VKKVTLIGLALIFLFTCAFDDECGDHKGVTDNKTAFVEQSHTETNQARLLAQQPPPDITWSLERDNLIKRFRLQNDRAVNFYMYVFIEGVADPIGYYMVNKVSSVDSQLTNTMQIVEAGSGQGNNGHILPSPAEDGSYGTNGNGVFGFTPEDVYIEHNMHYLVSTIPLQFAHPVVRLAVVNTPEAQSILEKTKAAMASPSPAK